MDARRNRAHQGPLTLFFTFLTGVVLVLTSCTFDNPAAERVVADGVVGSGHLLRSFAEDEAYLSELTKPALINLIFIKMRDDKNVVDMNEARRDEGREFSAEELENHRIRFEREADLLARLVCTRTDDEDAIEAAYYELHDILGITDTRPELTSAD